jgi:hypothetical protein
LQGSLIIFRLLHIRDGIGSTVRAKLYTMPNKVRALHGSMMQWAMVQNLVQETPFSVAFLHPLDVSCIVV